MAKIPRIDLGDRPSATYNPTADASAAAMMGSVADATGDLLATVTAEEQAERKRLAEALEAKQRIVDASNAGRVSLEFEDTHFKTLAQLERDYANTPEKIPSAYTDIMREQAEAIRKREDVNDTVKLMAVKDAESTMSSGLRQAYSISSNLQTKQVKGNLASVANRTVNGAAYQQSAEKAQQYAAAEIAKLMPQLTFVYGKTAKEEADKLRRTIAARYAAHAARNNPQQLAAELKSSPFLLAMEDADHKAAEAAADASYFKINDIRNLDIAKEAYSAGETLAATLGTDEFIGAAADRVKKLEAEREMARLGRDEAGRQLKSTDAKARVELIDQQIKRVQKLQAMNYKQLDPVGIDDPDEMRVLVQGQLDLTGKIAKSSVKKNLEAISVQMDRLTEARDAKKITPGTYRVYRDKLSALYKGAVGSQRTNDGFLGFMNAEEVGVNELNKRFRTSHAQVPQEKRDEVWIEYTRIVNATGEKLTGAEAIKIADQVLSRKSGTEVTGAFD